MNPNKPHEKSDYRRLKDTEHQLREIKRQRDDLLEACKEAKSLLEYIQFKYKSAPAFPKVSMLIDDAINQAEEE